PDRIQEQQRRRRRRRRPTRHDDESAHHDNGGRTHLESDPEPESQSSRSRTRSQRRRRRPGVAGESAMASVSLENQLQSAQKNLLFLQQDHANTLKGLHSEIRRLQQHCTDLTYELIVKSSDPAGKTRPSQALLMVTERLHSHSSVG
ncbi:hypothetical protein Z043_117252, partial [Scleropages formosus]